MPNRPADYSYVEKLLAQAESRLAEVIAEREARRVQYQMAQARWNEIIHEQEAVETAIRMLKIHAPRKD